MTDPRRPVLVGHDPDFSALVALLCGGSSVPLKKGALARIDAGQADWERTVKTATTSWISAASRSSLTVGISSS